MSPANPYYTAGGGATARATGTPTTTTPASYTLSNGTTSPYDPSTNYGNSGMSQTAYQQMYGSPTQQAGASEAASTAANAAGTAQVNNPAVNPNLPNSTVPGSAAANAAAPNTYGTQSGPGIMQQWFDERASGTDPGYEYATGRGLTSLDNAASARGGYNGGASMQQDSDYLANMGSQRESQLDSLASGASNEYQNQLSTMYGLGSNLASGQASTGSSYDTAGANAMSAANSNALNLGTQAATVPYMANQNLVNQATGALAKLF